MPLPSPRKGESKNNFVSRYVKAVMSEGRPQKQAVAMAMSAWEKSKGRKG